MRRGMRSRRRRDEGRFSALHDAAPKRRDTSRSKEQAPLRHRRRALPASCRQRAPVASLRRADRARTRTHILHSDQDRIIGPNGSSGRALAGLILGKLDDSGEVLLRPGSVAASNGRRRTLDVENSVREYRRLQDYVIVRAVAPRHRLSEVLPAGRIDSPVKALSSGEREPLAAGGGTFHRADVDRSR